MEPNCIIKCINATCDQRLSVPTGLGRIKVTCARCKTKWIWSPSEDVPEMLELPFRCALTGNCFNVAFGRYHRNHKYRVVHVSPATAIQAPSTPQPMSHPLLTKILGSFLSVAKPASQPKPSPLARQTFDASEFDFGGWFCPCCGYSRDVPAYPQFVRCGTCKEFVCGGRVTRVSTGIATYECHDECKGSGRISENHIETFDGSPISAPLGSTSALSPSVPDPKNAVHSSEVPKKIIPPSDQTLLDDNP